MGLESAFNQISDLNASWPLSTDQRSLGDDHLRGVKNVIKSLLTNVAQIGMAVVEMTLVAPTTVVPYTGVVTTGGLVAVKLLQDGIGGRAITWAAIFKNADVNLSTAPNTYTMFLFVGAADGNLYHIIGGEAIAGGGTVTSVSGTTNEIASTGGTTPVLSIAPTFDISGKTSTKSVKAGTTLPATCGVGELFFKTNATAGLNLYGCTAPNTWTLLGDGTGTGGTYTDRGDPSVFDKDTADWTGDGAWHDWNLSAIVPAGAKAIAIRIYAYSAASGNYIYFRKKGNSNVTNVSAIYTQGAGLVASADLVVACDSNRAIQYLESSGAVWSAVRAVVKGWWT